MEIKSLQGRHKRGAAKLLKLGRNAIQHVSDDKFQAILKKVPSGPDPAAWKQAKKTRRTLKLLRNAQINRPLIIHQGFRESEVLDALFPERREKWLHSWKRSTFEEVSLKSFSFLDEPIETMKLLRRIAECETSCRGFLMHFEDHHCLDITPYMVLGLIRQKMLPVCSGGRIKSGIGRVIHAVHLDEYLSMDINLRGSAMILPFPLRERRGKGASKNDNSAWSVTSEERVDSKLTDTINVWLSALDPPQQLSQFGRTNILTLAGEILDNAKRHSDLSEDGTWAIAGFMEARLRNDDSIAYVCHLGIINPGLTIFETLQAAPPALSEKIASFASTHSPKWPKKRRFDEETLWTLCSLQDGVSRVPSDVTPNGFGMLTLVEAMNALGRTARPDEQPRMTIISGKACLMVRPPYSLPSQSESGHRVLALNASNDLKYAPDEDYAFSLPYRFPGTIVAMRFCLDSDELRPAASKDD